jgi:ABC-2 type transport system permease protein
LNRGLLIKTLHEIRWPAVIFAAALLIAEGWIAFAIPRLLGSYAEQLRQLQFATKIAGSLLGTGSVEEFTPQIMRSFAWVHPIVLAILWAQAIWFCTRVPAGEIDRGTIDVLLSQPLSRMDVMITDAVTCAVAGLLPAFAALLGNVAGSRLAGSGAALLPGPVIAVGVNLYAMFIAVAGMTYLVSSCSDRRGRAVGVALGVLLASFLVNFIAQLVPAARPFGVISVLEYYRPLPIVQTGRWPTADIAILFGCGVVCWIAAVATFRRRDLRTV